MTIVSNTPYPSQVNNWRDIDTGTPEGLRAIDRLIAKRLGYVVIALAKFEGIDGERHLLVAPHARAYSHDDYKLLIQAAGDYNRRTLEEAWLDCPEYSSDLNAAFELADSQTHIRTRRGSQDEQIWGVQLKLQDETYQDTSLAVAICKAWLGWHDWYEDLYARIAAEQDENGGQSS